MIILDFKIIMKRGDEMYTKKELDLIHKQLEAISPSLLTEQIIKQLLGSGEIKKIIVKETIITARYYRTSDISSLLM